MPQIKHAPRGKRQAHWVKRVFGKSGAKHARHGKRQSQWTTRLFSKSAGYYSTMENIWKGTNARRKGLRTGGFNRRMKLSK
jgi:hypothetical protein